LANEKRKNGTEASAVGWAQKRIARGIADDVSDPRQEPGGIN
jgi:hypothetical protein